MVVETISEKIRKQQFKSLADDGLLVIDSGDASNNTNTLYTVPSGKVFYIVSVTIQTYDTTGASGGLGTLTINGKEIFRISAADIDETQQILSLSFSIPLKIIAAETIKLISDRTQFNVKGTFSGYEFDA